MRTALKLVSNNDHNTAIELAKHHRHLIALVGSKQDRAAFQALFEHFAPRIKAMMLKGGVNMMQAEDLMQDVMMTVWRKSSQFSPDRGTVGAWIFTIARNARIDLFRKASSRPYDDVYEMEIADDGQSSDDAMLQVEREECVSAAMKELPQDQRDVIQLAFIADMSQSEIAKKLSLPIGTVKSRMRLAYGKLKGKLEAVR
ncbi:sigma-70 family RNA polymerase sigma factor [Maritalea porphyrae]|uniref:sigma-70 family RNA polymerase sigma factor n=1 Tax=Maritalea porphyrae TaxID=880732 RepID=UPI0022AE9B52|nr:sigma-70 family RNA polymerase sigma factor [Maritalea porphyrae]MCZ4273502.1 sigma-70 family RNA polymerase sigma factor [Maritalea porphyrae]